MALKFNEIDVTEPVSGRTVYRGAYWVCVEGDPKRALFYGSSPQCNTNKSIVERNLNTLYKGLKVSALFIDIAYVPNRS